MVAKANRPCGHNTNANACFRSLRARKSWYDTVHGHNYVDSRAGLRDVESKIVENLHLQVLSRAVVNDLESPNVDSFYHTIPCSLRMTCSRRT